MGKLIDGYLEERSPVQVAGKPGHQTLLVWLVDCTRLRCTYPQAAILVSGAGDMLLIECIGLGSGEGREGATQLAGHCGRRSSRISLCWRPG